MTPQARPRVERIYRSSVRTVPQKSPYPIKITRSAPVSSSVLPPRSSRAPLWSKHPTVVFFDTKHDSNRDFFPLVFFGPLFLLVVGVYPVSSLLVRSSFLSFHPARDPIPRFLDLELLPSKFLPRWLPKLHCPSFPQLPTRLRSTRLHPDPSLFTT